MTKYLLAALAVALAASGCLTLPPHWQPDPKDKSAEQAAPADDVPPRVRKPITCKDVNEKNAHEMAQALWDELDRDQAGRR